MAQQDGQVHKVLGSEALGILLGRWRDGTFSGIADDWRWIAGYTKRYRWAVALYIVLGVAESSLSLVSAVAGKYAIDVITGYETSNINGVMDGDLDGFINAYLTAEATGNWATK